MNPGQARSSHKKYAPSSYLLCTFYANKNDVKRKNEKTKTGTSVPGKNKELPA
jgi:hypothetical protein